MVKVTVLTAFGLNLAQASTTNISLTNTSTSLSPVYTKEGSHNRSEPQDWTVYHVGKLARHQTNVTVAIGEVIELKCRFPNPPASARPKVNIIL